MHENDALQIKNREHVEALRQTNADLRSQVDRDRDILAAQEAAKRLGQDILDRLPVVVIGVDGNSDVTLANRLANEVFSTCSNQVNRSRPAYPPTSSTRRRRQACDPVAVALPTGRWIFQIESLEGRGACYPAIPIPSEVSMSSTTAAAARRTTPCTHPR